MHRENLPPETLQFLAHSMSYAIVQRPSSVCLSIRLSICKHFAQIASSTQQMAGLPPNLHTMVPRRARIQDMLKVKVEFKGHVIGTLLWFHENRFFSHANVWIATKLSLDGPQKSLHPGRARGRGQGHMIQTLLWFHENIFSQANGWNATKLAHNGSQPGLHPGYAQGQGRGITCTSVMSQNVCCTVRSHVLSLRALTLWSTIILSFQYKYQAARSNF